VDLPRLQQSKKRYRSRNCSTRSWRFLVGNEGTQQNAKHTSALLASAIFRESHSHTKGGERHAEITTSAQSRVAAPGGASPASDLPSKLGSSGPGQDRGHDAWCAATSSGCFQATSRYAACRCIGREGVERHAETSTDGPPRFDASSDPGLASCLPAKFGATGPGQDRGHGTKGPAIGTACFQTPSAPAACRCSGHDPAGREHPEIDRILVNRSALHA